MALEQELLLRALRGKYRWASPNGDLTIEDLFGLPLETKRQHQASLDNIAVELDSQVNSTRKSSFLKATTSADSETKDKFDIVVGIIELRQAENELLAEKRRRTEQNDRIRSIIAKKRNENLESLPLEELEKMLSN